MGVSSGNIGLIAICKSKPDRVEETREAFLAAVVWSREEPGCVEYKLHTDREKPNEFVFYEVWKDKAALDFHNSRDEFKELIEQLDELLTEPATLITLERIA